MTIISLKVESLAVLIPVGRLVKFAPLIAGSAPVKLPAGIEVRFAAEAAGSVAGNLASGIVPEPRLLAFNEVKLNPEPANTLAITAPLNVATPTTFNPPPVILTSSVKVVIPTTFNPPAAVSYTHLTLPTT